MPEELLDQEVHRLGRALQTRSAEVLDIVLRLNEEAHGDLLEEAVSEQLQRICRIATIWK